MTANKYDDTGWPVCVVTWTPEGTTLAGHDEFMAQLDRWLLRGRCGVIMDVRAGGRPDSVLRKHIAEQKKARKDAMRAHFVMALVVANSIQRGVLMAVAWVSPPSHPERAFTDFEEARAWCAEEIAHP